MALSEKKMALLKNKLEMPLVVRDLLITKQAPAEDATYALHTLMSNMQPEDAILCAAFTMKEIASFEADMSDDTKFLHMECDRIIERYSVRKDIAEENPDLWAETESDMLPVIADDISDFLELVFLCYMSLEVTNPNTADILKIITTQLQSQLVIIDEVLSLQDNLELQSTTEGSGDAEGNIIVFPG